MFVNTQPGDNITTVTGVNTVSMANQQQSNTAPPVLRPTKEEVNRDVEIYYVDEDDEVPGGAFIDVTTIEDLKPPNNKT